jgi:hypothetical protein
MFSFGPVKNLENPLTLFTAGSLTISTAGSGSITIACPNFSETFTKTRELARAIGLCISTPTADAFVVEVGDITVQQYPIGPIPEPWPGCQLIVTDSSPVFVLNLSQTQAQTLAAALNLYSVSWQ